VTTATGDAPGRAVAELRPVDGSCSHWLGASYCRAREGVRPYLPGPRCPVHTPNALAGQPEPPPGPGIPAYRPKDTTS
jgi:hypothetical protein